jgi:hypothetical protein
MTAMRMRVTKPRNTGTTDRIEFNTERKRILLEALAQTEGLTREDVLALMHGRQLRERTFPWRVLKTLIDSNGFADGAATYSGASLTGNIKTRNTVIARLIDDGYIEKVYRITDLGRKAFALATPLRKAKEKRNA